MHKINAAILVAAGLIMGVMGTVYSVQAEVMTAQDIMVKNYFVGKLKTVRDMATMTLINSRGETRKREMDMAGKRQGNGIDSNLIIRYQFPPDIKGTGFLQIEHSDGEDDLWIYLPALRKTRRLVSNNKKDSFFGSDFSYGDILLPKVEPYHHTILRSEIIDGYDCYVIESIPKTEQEKNNTGYSKRINWVRKDNYLETKVVYYDTEGALLKTQIAKKHTLVEPENQRWLGLHREMVNHQTGHKTILEEDQVKVGMPIPDEFFTIKTLEREWRR